MNRAGDALTIAAVRVARRGLRLVRPGGGTALPGIVAVRLAPGLVARILQRPPLGLVVVSGSSGKSTTAALIRAVLEGHGLRVLANRRTANIPHGIAAELVPQVDLLGRSRADVAVIEVDEGYAGSVAAAVPARVVVLLNVMIDQLHRWQEPELVARYLRRAGLAATDALVVNADDPHLARIGLEAEGRGATVRRFGVAPAARGTAVSAPDFSGPGLPAAPLDAEVEAVERDVARIRTAAGTGPVRLPGRGPHIAADAAAALEAAAAILGDRFDDGLARSALEGAATVFGREETVVVRGVELDLVLTKSPATMQVNLDLLEDDPAPTLVAIGRDIFDASQLWLADWRALRRVDLVSGWQAWEAALRLAYDEVEVGRVEPDLARAVADHLAAPVPDGTRRRVVMTPESMRRIRRGLRLDRRTAR